MLTIPVRLDIDTGEVKAALDDLEKGSKEAFEALLAYDKTKISVEYSLDINGREVREELDGVQKKIRDLDRERKRATGGEQGSIGRTKALIKQLERQRQETRLNTKNWYDLGAALVKAKSELRTLQGVQDGSITRLKEQRAELVQLRNNVSRTSSQYLKLTESIEKLDAQLGKVNPKVEKQFKLFSLAGKIAVAGAAFNSVTAALRSVGNAAGVYVKRQKEIEAFDLALRNVGMTQAEVSLTFNKAAAIARKLGAPLQQVEGLYKRMVPVLKSVGASSSETDRFIEGVSARTQTLGLNTEQSSRYLEAFAQVLSKGKLQSEELNQQISELDGSFRVQLADALEVTTEELNAMIKNSEVTAEVFVKAVNRMSNGTEELIKRVKEGRATIQQLQNLIQIIDTKNIENIGKAVEPVIKSFLNIRLSFANFIAEFQKTKLFEAFTKIITTLSKGIENFSFTFLKLAEILINILTPFTALISVLSDINTFFGGGLVVVAGYVAAFLGLAKLFGSIGNQSKKAAQSLDVFGESFKKQKTKIDKTQVGLKKYEQTLKLTAKEMGKTAIGLTGLRRAFFRKSSVVKIAGKEVQKYEFSLKKAGIVAKRFVKNLKGIGETLSQVFNPTTALIGAVFALGDAFVNFYQRITKANRAISEYKRVSMEIEAANRGLAKSTEKSQKTVAEATKEATQPLRDQAVAYTTLGIVSAAAFIAAVASGGFASGFSLAAIAATASAVGLGTSIYKLDQAFGEIDNINTFNEEVKKDFENVQKLDKGILKLSSSLKLNDKELGKQNNLTNDQIKRKKALVTTLDAEIQRLSENGEANNELIKIRLKQKQQVEDQIAQAKKLADAQKEELATRIAFRRESDLSTASIEVLTAALKKQEDSIKDAGIQGRIAAVKEFGKSQEDAGRLAAANLGIQIAENKQLIAASSKYVKELERRQATGKVLSADEQKELRRLTGVVRTETLKRIQLEQQAKAAIVGAFEAGIRKAQELGDVYGSISGNLKSAFDGVTSSLTGGLQSAVGLIDAVVQREIRGLEVGSAKRKRIILEQLKGQALANDIENSIAQTKLRVQKTIAVSEARIAKLRLEAEAAIAKSRGQTGVAKALSEAANLQNLIIRSKEKEFEFNSKALKLEKAKKDELLIMKGLEEEIGSNADVTARKIGVQKTNLRDANKEYKELADESKAFGDQLAKSAEKMQETKEEANKTSLRNGVEESQKVASALEASKDYVEDLSDNFDTAIKKMATAEASSKRMQSYLKNSATEANRLAAIVTSGTPRRAMGGPVESGQTYRVNDGGGREGFLSSAGKFSMLPASRNINWTAPKSGTVIPANLVDQYRNALAGQEVKVSASAINPISTRANNLSASLDSGNLVQRMAAVMSASGGEQRITNHVTIQSQEPVTDASKIMTNVARMKLRRGGNF